MNRVLDERIADRLAEAKFEVQQARTYWKERDQSSKQDPTPENLRETGAALAALTEAEQMHNWMWNEVAKQKHQR